jgi:hypothetical protein
MFPLLPGPFFCDLVLMAPYHRSSFYCHFYLVTLKIFSSNLLVLLRVYVIWVADYQNPQPTTYQNPKNI